MSDILIFRFEETNGPGYFGHFLDARSMPYRVVKVDRNEAVPSSIDGTPALVFMGGGMSVNDDLDWIPPILDLIRQGARRDIPMLGHCLGGQLISKALGGEVRKFPPNEIGWLPVDIVDNGAAPAWRDGMAPTQRVFQWHNETFSIPPGATHLFSSDACPNQAFQIGNTLGLQFHLEILPQMVNDWARLFIDEKHTPSATIQSRQCMTEDLDRKFESSTALADRIYHHWLHPIT